MFGLLTRQLIISSYFKLEYLPDYTSSACVVNISIQTRRNGLPISCWFGQLLLFGLKLSTSKIKIEYYNLIVVPIYTAYLCLIKYNMSV